MNPNLVSALRATALAATLLVTASAFAQSPDRAAQLLAVAGSIPVSHAGPYIAAGTYRVQVSAQLGRPTASLPDGTWLYENFNADDSGASGTLVVRFVDGRVRSLSLASPSAVTALRVSPKARDHQSLAAAWERP